MKIYTKGGDKGQTGLYDGSRVPKNDSRIMANGTIDEVNSIFGILLSHNPTKEVKDIIGSLQHILFRVGSDVATPEGTREIKRIGKEDVEMLEKWIDALDAKLPPLTQFIIPGGLLTASYLNHARSVTRRAERELISVKNLNPFIIQFMNRLSDLLFVLARFENLGGKEELA